MAALQTERQVRPSWLSKTMMWERFCFMASINGWLLPLIRVENGSPEPAHPPAVRIWLPAGKKYDRVPGLSVERPSWGREGNRLDSNYFSCRDFLIVFFLPESLRHSKHVEERSVSNWDFIFTPPPQKQTLPTRWIWNWLWTKIQKKKRRNAWASEDTCQCSC